MNAINYIHSYVHKGAWVFDDFSRELDKEPFVAGADLLLDVMADNDGNRKEGQTCGFYFGATPIPDWNVQLKIHSKDGNDGTFYTVDLPELGKQDEGPIWLCPALLKFFEDSPENIYVKINR
jgi:hypothetical protein